MEKTKDPHPPTLTKTIQKPPESGPRNPKRLKQNARTIDACGCLNRCHQCRKPTTITQKSPPNQNARPNQSNTEANERIRHEACVLGPGSTNNRNCNFIYLQFFQKAGPPILISHPQRSPTSVSTRELNGILYKLYHLSLI